ncbi:MAG: hypothetical protein NTV22_08860, partial [bacterium]|nr:hypothetical protein [bacterium]
MNKIKVTLLATAIVGLLAGPAWCGIIAFDDYAVTLEGGATGALNAETNGLAWRTGYEVQSPPQAGYLITNEPPLGYNTPTQILLTNGSFASGGSAWTASGRQFNTGNEWDPNSGAPSLTSVIKRISNEPVGAFIGADGANIWISFLARNNAGSDYNISLNSGEYGWYAREDNAPRPFVKLRVSSGQWALEGKGTNAGNTLVSTGISRTLGDAYLMVLNMAFTDGNDVTKLYVNPSSL